MIMYMQVYVTCTQSINLSCDRGINALKPNLNLTGVELIKKYNFQFQLAGTASCDFEIRMLSFTVVCVTDLINLTLRVKLV